MGSGGQSLNAKGRWKNFKDFEKWADKHMDSKEVNEFFKGADSLNTEYNLTEWQNRIDEYGFNEYHDNSIDLEINALEKQRIDKPKTPYEYGINEAVREEIERLEEFRKKNKKNKGGKAPEEIGIATSTKKYY